MAPAVRVPVAGIATELFRLAPERLSADALAFAELPRSAFAVARHPVSAIGTIAFISHSWLRPACGA